MSKKSQPALGETGRNFFTSLLCGAAGIVILFIIFAIIRLIYGA